jgi:Raf kinase inhibitor-like YbhB/YbcL family protein
MEPEEQSTGIQLISAAFEEDGKIPKEFTCKGQNINPPLNVINVPKNAKSLALIMHDPDAPGMDFVHWIIWDIPSNTRAIGSNGVPIGAVQGTNSSGNSVYLGPCPPDGTGTHHYVFELYALDTNLSLSPDITNDKLQQAIEGHVIEQCKLTGLVSAPN